MPPWFDDILQSAFTAIFGESQRALKRKAWGAGLRALNGVRRLVLLQYGIMIFCFLVAGSLMATTWILVEQWSQGAFAFTIQLKFFMTAAALLSGLLFLTVREKTWLAVLNLEEQARKLRQESAAPDREDLAQMISAIVEAKLAAHENRQVAEPRAKGETEADTEAGGETTGQPKSTA